MLKINCSTFALITFVSLHVLFTSALAAFIALTKQTPGYTAVAGYTARVNTTRYYNKGSLAAGKATYARVKEVLVCKWLCRGCLKHRAFRLKKKKRVKVFSGGTFLKEYKLY